uniref:Ubiquitin-like modifier-activating enzyme Atg7 N-terminal domain-containing protein n=2 Tax=Clastoptera arizonana TaxID=38151 RepID=A0A1B6E024_9HEMI
MAEKESSKLLKYMPFTSLIEPTFWHKFCDLKLEVDKLNEKERFLWGYYFKEYNNPTLSLNCSSFNNEYENHTNSLCAHGFHVNKNTVEAFKECDKQILLQQYGQYFRENIISGKALNDPSLLVTFILLTFADLKKFHFYYWFAFPASLKTFTNLCCEPVNMSSLFTTEQIKNIFQSHASLSYSQKGFFGIIHIGDMLHVCTLKEIVQHLNSEKKNEKSYIGFVDPNSEELNPGWPLRNLLYLLAHYCPESMFGSEIEVICLRKLESSIVLTLQLSDNVGDQSEKFVGWEKNQRGKFGPKFVDLSETMDPIK